jgi:hypothetical protein
MEQEEMTNKKYQQEVAPVLENVIKEWDANSAIATLGYDPFPVLLHDDPRVNSYIQFRMPTICIGGLDTRCFVNVMKDYRDKHMQEETISLRHPGDIICYNHKYQSDGVNRSVINKDASFGIKEAEVHLVADAC